MVCQASKLIFGEERHHSDSGNDVVGSENTNANEIELSRCSAAQKDDDGGGDLVVFACC